ncbi:MAG: 4-hydroxy-tetrahydrodipicolinate synthase [Alistipes sp. 58_9_plus]|nr:MAG: 4-hydroxy-tetrahydrodipicolinate synthase [Alistipes sp. 58_9_plus]
MDTSRFCGAGAALITPFKKDFSYDIEALESLIDYIIDGGTDYIVALGTTAETPTIKPSDRGNILHIIKQRIASRVPLVAGLGGNCTAEVVEYVNKPSQEGLYRHFRAIAEASPIPVILYNIPGRTGVNMTAETTCRLAADEPNIIAVKEASGKIEQIEQIIRNRPDGFRVISGDDSLTLEVMRRGGDGVISVAANAFPKMVSRMVDLAAAGDYDSAEQIMGRLREAIAALFEQGNPTGIKAALAVMGRIENVLRLPLVPATEPLMKKIKTLITEYDLR